MLAVDLSGSERFGTRGRFKSELASELAAVLAMSAIRNNDRVGALLFTDRIEHVVPPRKGRRHALRLMRDLLVFEPSARAPTWRRRCEYTSQMLAHKAIIFVVSDFQAPEHRASAQAAGAATRRRRRDGRRSERAGAAGRRAWRASSIPRRARRSTSTPATRDVRAQFAAAVEEELTRRRRLLRRLAIDEIPVHTDGRRRRAADQVLPRARDRAHAGGERARVVSRAARPRAGVARRLGDAAARAGRAGAIRPRDDHGAGRRHGRSRHGDGGRRRAAHRPRARAARRDGELSRPALDSLGPVQALEPPVVRDGADSQRGRPCRDVPRRGVGRRQAADPARRRASSRRTTASGEWR